MKRPVSSPRHPKLSRLGDPRGIVPYDAEKFPDIDCAITIHGDSFKASEGIRTGDMAMISCTREPRPGNLVIAHTPKDGIRLMRVIPADEPFLRSDNPTIPDVPMNAEGMRIIGVVVDTVRNPVIERYEA